MNSNLSRRMVLRGTMGAATTTVALPLLDCFLNSNGTALAATGAPLPVRFGHWFQALGLNPGMWVPEKVGEGFQNNHHRYPSSARFSYRWHEVDLGFVVCRLLEAVRVLRVVDKTLMPRAG